MLRKAAAVGLLALCSCGDSVPSLSVSTPQNRQDVFGAEEVGVIASGARDIPCDLHGVVAVAKLSSRGRFDAYVVEGCGQRLTYFCSTRCILTSRLTLAPAAP